jgi:hypothetical protein
MKTRWGLLVACTSLLCGATINLVACGDVQPAIPSTSDAGGSSGGGAGGGGGGGGDGGASLPDAASDPGYVTCGNAECRLADGEACCWTDTRTCMVGCPNSAMFELHCDESADCTDGTNRRCCVTGLAAVCMAECPSDGYPLCRTQAECDGAECALKTCAGRDLQVCGAPPDCQ